MNLNHFEVVMLLLQVGAAGWCFSDGLHWRALYWVGAFILTLAVLKGLNT